MIPDRGLFSCGTPTDSRALSVATLKTFIAANQAGTATGSSSTSSSLTEISLETPGSSMVTP